MFLNHELDLESIYYRSESSELMDTLKLFKEIFEKYSATIRKNSYFGNKNVDGSLFEQIRAHAAGEPRREIYNSTFAYIYKKIKPRVIYSDDGEDNDRPITITKIPVGTIEKPIEIKTDSVLVFRISLVEANEIFEELIKAIPPNLIHRVLRTKDEGLIYLYPNLIESEAKELQKEIEPIDSGKMLVFLQGQWVITSATKIDKIASHGQAHEACRYYLLYDPVKKIVAATHLDLIHDKEAVLEMLLHMMQAGCKKENIQFWGSQNIDWKDELQTIFKQTNFDLDGEFVFNIKDGTAEYPTDEEMNLIDKYMDKKMPAIETGTRARIKNKLPQVLVFDNI